MFKNNYIRLIYALLFGSIILFLVFRPEPKFTVAEKKIGDIVYTDTFWLKVLEARYQLGNITVVDIAIRNIANSPILFCVTNPGNKTDDLQFKKYYFVIERDGRIYSSCCKNFLVEPGDTSGRFDRECRIYFEGIITGSDNFFLRVSKDPEGREVISKIKLTTNRR